MPPISAAVQIGVSLLKGYAVGDTIEARFTNVLQHLDDGCYMTVNPDERFRAAVGAVLVSYSPDSPEYTRVLMELQQIQRVSAIITAAQAGLSVTMEEPDPAFVPVGLLGLFHTAARDSRRPRV